MRIHVETSRVLELVLVIDGASGTANDMSACVLASLLVGLATWYTCYRQSAAAVAGVRELFAAVS